MSLSLSLVIVFWRCSYCWVRDAFCAERDVVRSLNCWRRIAFRLFLTWAGAITKRVKRAITMAKRIMFTSYMVTVRRRVYIREMMDVFLSVAVAE